MENMVLVVDNDPRSRALARAALEDGGFDVCLAEDGEQALAMVGEHRPACILMDIRMPDLDGIAACERIRALPDGGGIAIVFVTARRDVTTFDRAVAAGGDDFLTKPFLADELVLHVRTALRVRRIATEVSGLVGELKHQRDRLQRIELQKEQLLAFLVHDLKNPVHSIALQARSLLRQADDVQRSRAAAERIRDETKILLRLITNLLDLAKADEGRLEPNIRAVDVNDLVTTVVAGLRPRASEAGVRIVTEIETPTLDGDADLIGRVLANLIDNAVRHAPEDSVVSVAIVPHNDGVEMRVADTGPGVPVEMRDAAFERFSTGAAMRTRSNRGLGLAFCKLVVEAHGGQISIGDVSPGAVFIVRLPRAAPGGA